MGSIIITPTGDDVVAASIDGISLFAAPFSSFKATAGDPNVYQLKLGNGVLIELDVTTGTLTVIGRKLDLAGLDMANGVDVQLTVGQAIAVQNVTMVAKAGRRYIYIAPAPLAPAQLAPALLAPAPPAPVGRVERSETRRR